MPAAAIALTVGKNEMKGGPMAVRVAINGFGRTGRAAFRAALEREADIEFPEATPELREHRDDDLNQ